ncbi:MAG: 50S ribosomal protein L10 [Ignavibacteria bacterium]
MDKKQKEQIVSEIKEKLNNASSIYLTDFTGLTVEETNEFRNEMFNAKVDYKVVKNTLLQKAINDGGKNKFSEQSGVIIENLKGPTGIIFAYDDPVSPAKIIKKFYEKIERPKLKIALIENITYDKSKLNDLAALPTKLEIVSSIIGSLHSPISGIVNSINAVIRDLASVIEEAVKKNQT